MLMKVEVDTTTILNLREKEILKELLQGSTYVEIAEKRNVPAERVMNIVTGICRKLGIQGG